MKNNYKEIIYLNQTELSSALAQLNKGYASSFVSRTENSSKSGSSNSLGAEVNFSAGIAGIAKGNGGSKSESATTSEDTELFGKELNIVFNDYNLERLLNSLNDNGKLNDLKNAQEGEFVLHTSKFSLTDFNFASNVLYDNAKNSINTSFKNAMKEADAYSKEFESEIKSIAHFIDFGNLLTQGNILIKMPGITAFAENASFRMNNGELQSISHTNRDLTILGIVESKAHDNEDDVSESFSEAVNNTHDLSQIGKIIPALTEMLFLASGLLRAGDVFVKPIALFFDN